MDEGPPPCLTESRALMSAAGGCDGGLPREWGTVAFAMLRCAQCDRPGEGAMVGWRAMLGTDGEGDDPRVEAFVFCPDCAEKEFGPSKQAGRASRE